MENKLCSICGEENDDYLHTLECGHTFHYNCTYLSFINIKNNTCPYCRSTGNHLPLVNGLKKIVPWIHNCDNSINYESKTCSMILKKGKNKGEKCTRNCKLGYNLCTQHLKIENKKYKDNKDNNNNE